MDLWMVVPRSAGAVWVVVAASETSRGPHGLWIDIVQDLGGLYRLRSNSSGPCGEGRSVEFTAFDWMDRDSPNARDSLGCRNGGVRGRRGRGGWNHETSSAR